MIDAEVGERQRSLLPVPFHTAVISSGCSMLSFLQAWKCQKLAAGRGVFVGTYSNSQTQSVGVTTEEHNVINGGVGQLSFF
jgi:hypothetical protein